MLDLLAIATADGHRHELRQLAVRRTVVAARADPPAVLSAADRRLLTSTGAAPALAAVEMADPLGVWTLRTRRPRTVHWPGWRTLLARGVWTGLGLLALAYGLGR